MTTTNSILQPIGMRIMRCEQCNKQTEHKVLRQYGIGQVTERILKCSVCGIIMRDIVSKRHMKASKREKTVWGGI